MIISGTLNGRRKQYDVQGLTPEVGDTHSDLTLTEVVEVFPVEYTGEGHYYNCKATRDFDGEEFDVYIATLED